MKNFVANFRLTFKNLSYFTHIFLFLIQKRLPPDKVEAPGWPFVNCDWVSQSLERAKLVIDSLHLKRECVQTEKKARTILLEERMRAEDGG